MRKSAGFEMRDVCGIKGSRRRWVRRNWIDTTQATAHVLELGDNSELSPMATTYPDH